METGLWGKTASYVACYRRSTLSQWCNRCRNLLCSVRKHGSSFTQSMLALSIEAILCRNYSSHWKQQCMPIWYAATYYLHSCCLWLVIIINLLLVFLETSVTQAWSNAVLNNHVIRWLKVPLTIGQGVEHLLGLRSHNWLTSWTVSTGFIIVAVKIFFTLFSWPENRWQQEESFYRFNVRKFIAKFNHVEGRDASFASFQRRFLLVTTAIY